MEKEQIIFLHIPKTAGTTLRNILYAQYDPATILPIYPKKPHTALQEFIQFSPTSKDQIDILIGHFGYGVHKWLSGNRPYRYATMLRHPITRCLSLYNHLKNQHFSACDISFQEIMHTVHGEQFKNSQSRLIAGGETKNIFAVAQQRIDQEFLFVGIAERFDESLLLAHHDLGWRLIPYKHLNITSKMWATNYADELRNNEESMSLLTELNTIDLQLYEYANNIFTKKMASFAESVGSF